MALSEGPASEDWTDELLGSLEQEASPGGSAEAVLSPFGAEGSEGAEET